MDGDSVVCICDSVVFLSVSQLFPDLNVTTVPSMAGMKAMGHTIAHAVAIIEVKNTSTPSMRLVLFAYSTKLTSVNVTIAPVIPIPIQMLSMLSFISVEEVDSTRNATPYRVSSLARFTHTLHAAVYSPTSYS